METSSTVGHEAASVPRRLRWFVAGVGAALLGAASAHPLADPDPPWLLALELLLPLALSIGLIALGVRTAGLEYDREDYRTINRVTALGAVVVGLLTAWLFYLGTLAGLAATEAVTTLASGVGIGGGTGALLGIYEVGWRREAERAGRYRDAVEASADGIAILDEHGRYTAVNRAHAEVYGYDDPGEMVGKPWQTCYDDGEIERLEREAYPHVEATGQWRGDATGRRADGTTFPQEVSLTALDDGGLVCVVRDVADRVERERRLAESERLYRLLAENFQGGIVFLFDEELRYSLVAGEGMDALGLDHDEIVGRTVQEVYPEETVDYLLPYYRRVLDGEEASFDVELQGREFEVSIVPVSEGGTGVAGLGIARDVTERRERDRQLSTLHRASRELTYATDPDEVAAVTADIAASVLDKSLSAMWLYDEEADELVSAAVTESSAALLGGADVESLPTITGDELGMEMFRTDKLTVIDDYATVDNPVFPELSLGTVVLVPIGDHGLLELGEAAIEPVDEQERHELEILALNAEAALDRAAREEQLRRQTSQMEFFNSILRHDVLNGMTVIRARAELLASELDDEQHRGYAETIVDWCDDVVDVVSRVRAVLETLTGDADLELGPVDLPPLLTAEVERVRRTYPEVTIEAEIPEAATVVADDLLADVFGNVIGNAVEHNDADEPCLSVGVDVGESTVAVRIVDDGPGVADDRKEVVFRRGETGHAKRTGSGFGLFFVDSMIEEYGGSVHVEDRPDGARGSVFVLEFRRA
jgi:PAS domain S-box-containing protein